MTDDEEIRRGREAERILAEPLLAEAFASLEARIIEEMRGTDVGARDKQRDLIVTLQLLGALKKHLQNHIATGKLAQLSKETTRDKLRRVFG